MYSVVGVVAVLVVASEVCGVVGLEVLLYFVVRAVVVNVVTTVVGDIGFVVAAAVVVVVLGVSVVGSGRTKYKECYRIRNLHIHIHISPKIIHCVSVHF